MQMDLLGSLSSFASSATKANPVGVAASAGLAVMGAIDMIGGTNERNRLMAQRKAFKTPQEYFDMYNAAQSMASQGYDAFTLSFLQNNIDQAFAESADASLKFGGDPNDVAALFSQRVSGLMKVGAENHAKNLENFSRWYAAKDLIGQNAEAEWASEQDILKDKIQAANQRRREGFQNIIGAINTFTSSGAAGKTMGLFPSENRGAAGAATGVAG